MLKKLLINKTVDCFLEILVDKFLYVVLWFNDLWTKRHAESDGDVPPPIQ